MNGSQVKKILDGADLKEVDGGFCIVSGAALFDQAKNIVMEAYKNASLLGLLVGEIAKTDVFEMRILNINDRKRIEAFLAVNKAWCSHARKFLGASFDTFEEQSSDQGIFSQYFNEVLEIKRSKRKNNVVAFPSPSDSRQEDYKADDVRTFLKISGFRILDNDVISRSDAESIVINTKEFIKDAYENAKMAKVISSDLLNAESEIHVLIGEKTLDDLSFASAKNEAWMILTNKSFFSQDEHLSRDSSVNHREIECAARKNRNVSIAKFPRHRNESKTRIEKQPLGIYRL